MYRRSRFMREAALSGAALLAATRAAGAHMGPKTLPHDVVVKAPNLFPESFAFSATTQRFYVGSLRYGRISSVAPDGSLATFSDDPALVSTFGIFTDEQRGLLYACNADVGLSTKTQTTTLRKLCELVVFDLKSGTLVKNVDLGAAVPGGPHLPNDGAIAADGSIYVTDTFLPVIYHVTSEGTPSVFVQDPRLGAPAGVPGLDGIQVASSGTVVANIISSGLLFRIDPVTKAISQVSVTGSAGPLIGADGMRFTADGRLWIAQSILGGNGARNALTALTSTDDWRTATVASEHPLSASSYQVAFAPAGAYVIQSGLEQLFKNPKAPDVDGFTVAAVAAA
jgi:sugar lactone lactonase YvrE